MREQNKGRGSDNDKCRLRDEYRDRSKGQGRSKGARKGHISKVSLGGGISGETRGGYSKM